MTPPKECPLTSSRRVAPVARNRGGLALRGVPRTGLQSRPDPGCEQPGQPASLTRHLCRMGVRRRRLLSLGLTPMDAESESIREVFARYGLAMYQAQCVERQLAIAAPMLHGMDPRTVTGDQVGDLLDSLFGRTFGAVISTLERSVGLPTGFESRLRKTLRLRNWLAHDYFWERAGEFNSTPGRDKMIQELEESATFLGALDAELTHESSAYYKSLGITGELLESLTQRLIAGGDRA